ncbi:MAG TPA: methyltransferase domain-containing protein [Alphaproteobacteria bacterium]|jgi:SAM-dependent methyltransferase|nr:methyltransferase domain-containing protein [Alphaproteobacteria bacterium]HJO88389.1 methyltransferase domain-containing protein [Alphaproteobacteria bacterium]|tara:strand:- start:261 stop:980 length:720 start_codon:yes stop_codon:yes gene_type:complete
MWTDIIDLRDFYFSPLGRVTQRMIRSRIHLMWPDVSGYAVLGLGYTTPYLRPFMEKAERVTAVMPRAQGALHWPPDGARLVTLADETALPFADSTVDRILLVHALESSEHLRAMMREVWRILISNGRLLVVAPNRRGIWARSGATPFGHGHPFTRSQLSRLLRDNMFTPLRSGTALFVPPLASQVALASAPAWEKLGECWFRGFSGVVLAEASKQIYATTPSPEVSRRVLAPLPKDVTR